MINFFRNIRRQLANENKFQKYFRYAFGEILLVVIGILIALQVNNWNEQRKQEAQFKVTLEQLYTSIKYDAEAFYRHSLTFNNQIETIDLLLKYPDSISDEQLPYALDFLTINGSPYTTESSYYSKDLIPNSNNAKQKELTKEVLGYINKVTNYKYYNEEGRLIKAIRDLDIARPKVNLKHITGPWDKSDPTYYDESDLINLHDWVRSRKYRAILKTERTSKIYNRENALNIYNDGLSIRNLIKEYYSDVKVFYEDVGIIGTSINGFDDLGGKSAPLTLTDKEQNIWELDLYLQVGRVKFRCRDSWAQNWGNKDFPKGIGVHDGSDIPIPEAGNYHIIFKPVTGEYEFIKQD